jgi:type II secretory pathway pseudopilin PulG
MMTRRLGYSRRGFTLVEALAAIAVMMIIIPVVLQGFVLADSIAKVTKQTSDATVLAQSQMERIIATEDWMSGSTGGDETIEPIRYHWDAILSDYNGQQGLQTLKVTVTWDWHGRVRTVELATLVYIPDNGSSTNSMQQIGGSLP